MFKHKKYMHRLLIFLTVVALVVMGSLNNSCIFNTATVLCEGYDVRCRTGQVCVIAQDNKAECVNAGDCGDGVVGPGEVCDDGNLIDGDGCSAECMSTESCGNG